MSRYLHFPPFFLDHVRYVRTDSYLDAPLSNARPSYPVLVYSHGWNGFRNLDTSLMQELASYGYVVVSVEHTYGAMVSVFPDGRVAYNNPDALPFGVSDEVYYAAANQLVTQWADDIAFTLDTLDEMNAGDTAHGFRGGLDLERLGVFGHSFGGGASVEFCARDPRCQAGVGLDAYVISVTESVRREGLRQPFLFLFSESWPSEPNTTFFDEIYSHSDEAAVFTILGTSHYDFTDLPMMSPIAPQLGLKGPLDGERVVQIVNAYTLALFDRALGGRATTLLDGPSPTYPEVILP
jgi:dienelactone hydrolase